MALFKKSGQKQLADEKTPVALPPPTPVDKKKGKVIAPVLREGAIVEIEINPPRLRFGGNTKTTGTVKAITKLPYTVQGRTVIHVVVSAPDGKGKLRAFRVEKDKLKVLK